MKPKADRPSMLTTMSLADAGRHLGITRERVRQLIEASQLTAHMVEGSAWPRVLRSDVEAAGKRRQQRGRK